jgi:hypothetical protein
MNALPVTHSIDVSSKKTYTSNVSKIIFYRDNLLEALGLCKACENDPCECAQREVCPENWTYVNPSKADNCGYFLHTSGDTIMVVDNHIVLWDHFTEDSEILFDVLTPETAMKNYNAGRYT